LGLRLDSQEAGIAMTVIDGTTTLSGRLVTLRPICREDYPTLFRWRSSFETVHYLNFRRRIATYEEFVRDLEMMLANGGMMLLVRKKTSGEPIGYTLANPVNPWDGWAVAGVHVEERYRLRGHGGELALLWVDFLFRVFPLKKIITEVYEFAERNIQLAEAMGFEESGFVADHFWWQDRSWGVHQMTLTRERWLKRRWDFAGIIDVQRRFAEITEISSDGHGGDE
jgi:RimJ/RimL family protein N-acetyltransferase